MERDLNKPNVMLSFERTKEFDDKVYEDAFLGELLLDKSQIDFDKPYTQIENDFYQADFATTVMRRGEEIPLLMMPVPQPYSFEQLKKNSDYQNLSDEELKRLPEDERYSEEELKKFPSPQTSSGLRRANASLLYLYADLNDNDEKFKTKEEIGNLYGVTKQLISQDIVRHHKDLNRISLSDTKIEFPFDSLGFDKLRSLSVRLSSATTIGSINEMHRMGMSPEEIRERVGGEKLSYGRIGLRKLNLASPENIKTNLKKAAEIIEDPDATLEGLRESIKTFGETSAIRSYRHLFESISQLQLEAWGNQNNRKTREAYNLLKDAGIPVQAVIHKQTINGKKHEYNYYITLKRCRNEVIDVLSQKASENWHVPVEQFAGKTLESLPSTNDLFGSRQGKYMLVGKRFAGGSSDKLAKLKLLIREANDFPVSVVKYNRTDKSAVLYISKSDLEKFNIWLASQKLDN